MIRKEHPLKTGVKVPLFVRCSQRAKGVLNSISLTSGTVAKKNDYAKLARDLNLNSERIDFFGNQKLKGKTEPKSDLTS